MPLSLSRKAGVVGMAGFEPTTSASRTQRSTKLSYIPKGNRDHTSGGVSVAGIARLGSLRTSPNR